MQIIMFYVSFYVNVYNIILVPLSIDLSSSVRLIY